MKLCILINILSFISSILNSSHEYDLTSGYSKYFSTLSTSDTYKFYIHATYDSNIVNIEFIKNDSSSNIQVEYQQLN